MSSDFHEAKYVAGNPDVRDAIAAGRFMSGWQHYELFGRAEGRLEGELRMAVPDRRFTFDFLRRESTLADVLDAYIRMPLPRMIPDHFLHYAEVDHAAAWRGELNAENVRPAESPGSAFATAQAAYRSQSYQDTHCWVFTPRSFAGLCRDLAELGLLHMECAGFHTTNHDEIEFFAAMRASASPARCVESWGRLFRELGDPAATPREPGMSGLR